MSAFKQMIIEKSDAVRRVLAGQGPHTIASDSAHGMVIHCNSEHIARDITNKLAANGYDTLLVDHRVSVLF